MMSFGPEIGQNLLKKEVRSGFFEHRNRTGEGSWRGLGRIFFAFMATPTLIYIYTFICMYAHLTIALNSLYQDGLFYFLISFLWRLIEK